MQFRRFRSAPRAQPDPEAWHPRRRDILGRLVRGTEAPTDTLPVIVNPERTQLSEYYDARLGEVLELAVSVGSVLMSSGMSAVERMTQVEAIAAAYGNRELRCRRDQHRHLHRRLPGADAATGQHAAHGALPVDGLQSTGRRRPAHRSDPCRAAAARVGTRRTRRNRHRPAPVQTLGRHPGLGRVGVLDGRHPGRRPPRLSHQCAEHHGDRPSEPTTESLRTTVFLPARGRRDNRHHTPHGAVPPSAQN